MDKLKYIRVQEEGGTYSDDIPLAVDAENVTMLNGHDLQETLGDLNVTNADDVTTQLSSLHSSVNSLNQQKVNHEDLSNYIDTQLASDVTAWLDTNVTPTGSAVSIDKTLTIEDSAADSKAVGNHLEKIEKYNTKIISEETIIYPSSITRSGVTFSKTTNNKGLIVGHMSGTATANIEINLVVGGENTYPNFLIPGNTQYIDLSLPSSAYISITLFANNFPSHEKTFYTNDIFKVPNNLAGCYIRLKIPNGTTVNSDWYIRFLDGIPDDIFSKEYFINKENQENILSFNAYDLLKDIVTWPTLSKYGVTYYATHQNGVNVTGTATQDSFTNIINGGLTIIPSGFIAGRKHYAKIINNTGSENIYASINVYSTSKGRIQYLFNQSNIFQVPSDLQGVIIQLFIRSGATVNGEWSLAISNSLPNYVITSAGGENNYYTNEYYNTYNITATPSISSLTDYSLTASGDTTDRTADIQTLLSTTGICRLGPGKFYVNGIDLPNRAILIGDGDKTQLILSSNATNNYAVKISNINNNISHIAIEGEGNRSDILAQTEIGTRHGILFQGTYDGDTAVSVPARALISDCIISGFTGGGITGQWSGSGRTSIMNVCNVHIQDCYAGINLPIRSEYHKFTNVSSVFCYYGCINNGGNNIFVNCSFSQNIIGFLINNENNQAWNNGHGSVIGCTFNHQNNNNNGLAIKIINGENGFVFTGCQLFYGHIYLDNAKGILISNCNFGRETITIKNSTTALISNCVFESNPTISIDNVAGTKIVNCINSSTGAYIS